MGKKIYKSLTVAGVTFPVPVGGVRKWITLGGDRNTYETSHEETQRAIERHRFFTGGRIGLVEGYEPLTEDEAYIRPGGENPPDTGGENPPDTGGENPPDTGKCEYPDVTDINGAVAVLKGEPFKVHPFTLKTPAAVRAQAALLGVVFPNWPTE